MVMATKDLLQRFLSNSTSDRVPTSFAFLTSRNIFLSLCVYILRLKHVTFVCCYNGGYRRRKTNIKGRVTRVCQRYQFVYPCYSPVVDDALL